jgi:hypothetical protein
MRNLDYIEDWSREVHMSRATKPPSPTLPASGSRPDLNPEGHHTCTRCPVCATEACKVLEQLGMYCETMCAASEAEAADPQARRPDAAA